MKKCNIFPPTSKRVSLKTNPQMNADIRNQTLRNLNIYKNCDEATISERIQNLNQEWDTERFLEVNSALLVILSSYLGIRNSRIWFILTGAIAVFMLQHAFIGWCPPLPLARKWGIRSEDEIQIEKTALKIMRGDFKEAHKSAEDALAMAEK